MIRMLFVYGTLQPCQPRWPALAPFVEQGAGTRTSVQGVLYRTPYGWPVATFDAVDTVVPGQVLTLRKTTAGVALDSLDRIEGVPSALFERVLVATTSGLVCHAYHWPHDTSGFVTITSWPPGNDQ